MWLVLRDEPEIAVLTVFPDTWTTRDELADVRPFASARDAQDFIARTFSRDEIDRVTIHPSYIPTWELA